jgi:uncharacterized membrane protein YhaH (DUF805 family)
MRRFKALFRDTWWMWLALILAGCLMGTFFSFVFFVTIPICIFSFVYFGLMRYDEDGNPTGEIG